MLPSPTALSDEQMQAVKEQFQPVLGRMSRMQIYELADFIYEEARNRREHNGKTIWHSEVRV